MESEDSHEVAATSITGCPCSPRKSLRRVQRTYQHRDRQRVASVPIPKGLIICCAAPTALQCVMPWRKKPASWLDYWEGPVRRDAGFKTILVWCIGPAREQSYHGTCHHNGRLRLDSLPDWDWYDISAHLKCTKCGTVGYVDTRVDWSEVIDFNKGIG